MNRSNGFLEQVTGLRGKKRSNFPGFDKRGRSKTYRSWESMKQRCLNPRFSSYKWYGGSGVSICNRWMNENGFINFLADMGETPIGLTLERIDVKGNYEPSNCIWATRKQQALNRHNTIRLTFNGKTQPLVVWAKEIGVCAGTLCSRFYKELPVEQILSRKIGK